VERSIREIQERKAAGGRGRRRRGRGGGRPPVESGLVSLRDADD
jgi:hypothetical protein